MQYCNKSAEILGSRNSQHRTNSHLDSELPWTGADAVPRVKKRQAQSMETQSVVVHSISTASFSHTTSSTPGRFGFR